MGNNALVGLEAATAIEAVPVLDDIERVEKGIVVDGVLRVLFGDVVII